MAYRGGGGGVKGVTARPLESPEFFGKKILANKLLSAWSPEYHSWVEAARENHSPWGIPLVPVGPAANSTFEPVRETS